MTLSGPVTKTVRVMSVRVGCGESEVMENGNIKKNKVKRRGKKREEGEELRRGNETRDKKKGKLTRII
jgi:hypothetical protein